MCGHLYDKNNIAVTSHDVLSEMGRSRSPRQKLNENVRIGVNYVVTPGHRDTSPAVPRKSVAK